MHVTLWNCWKTLKILKSENGKGKRGDLENAWKDPDFQIKGFPGIFRAIFLCVFHGSCAMKIARIRVFFGCGFFAYSWKVPAYSGASLLTVDNFSFSACSWSFLAYSCSFFAYSWSFFAYSGKVPLIRASRDCKQRSLTVSKKAPTVSKKASPVFFRHVSGVFWVEKGIFKFVAAHDCRYPLSRYTCRSWFPGF